jgi:hypothetical protein
MNGKSMLIEKLSEIKIHASTKNFIFGKGVGLRIEGANIFDFDVTSLISRVFFKLSQV